MVAALCLYAVLDGADFGVGVWKFITALQSDRKQRQVIWEANHVWLIFVAIILFNGFPPAFVALNRVLLMSPFSGVIGHCIPWRGFCISRYGAESEVLQRSSESGFDGHSVFP